MLMCLFGVTLSVAEVSDEEGLRRRRERMPKSNTAQKIATVPYYIIRTPFFLLGRGVWYSYAFVRDTHVVPKTVDLLTSDDGLVSLFPTASLGGRSGLTGELTYSHRRFLKRGNRLNLHTSYSVNGYQDHYARYRAFNLIGPVFLDVRGGFNVNTSEDFYGIGPDLSDVEGDGDLNDQTNFRHERLGGNLKIGAQWNRYLSSSVLVDFIDHTIETGEGTSTSTLNKFTEADIPGLEGAALLGLGGRLAFDTRDNDFYPNKGFLAAISAMVFNQTDDDKYGFVRYNLELGHYLTLFRTGRIFAVRLLGEINTRTSDDKTTPFFSRASLGGSDNLRGYNTGRFRDKDLILLNLEYRYPIWEAESTRVAAMDAVLFLDAGRVFDDLADHTFKDYKLSYGVGIRARTPDSFVLRVEFAHSDEENQIAFAFAPFF